MPEPTGPPRPAVVLLDRDGPVLEVPLEAADAGDASGWEIFGGAAGFTVRLSTRSAATGLPRWRCRLDLEYADRGPVDRGVRVRLALPGTGRPHWLVPAIFYGENRSERCRRPYPRWDPAGGDPARLVASAWSFRADRAATPVVFGTTEEACTALATRETSPLGPTGVGFAGDAERREIWLDFPYREEPVTYDGSADARPADVRLHRWLPGARVTLEFDAYRGEPGLHSYDPFLRALYARDVSEHRLRPWMDAEAAAEHTAHGLLRWHYRPEHAALFETAAFDRELNDGVAGAADRPHMHVAWLSGAPSAGALLRYGRRAGDRECVAAGLAVLDRISGGLSPSGLFWGEWRVGRGWSAGWNADPRWIHMRTAAEATLFLVRAIVAERAAGARHPGWEAAVRSNLEAALRAQRHDGSFGTYLDHDSGEVAEWEGAGGLPWIAALLAADDAFGGSTAFRAAAERAGRYYARFVERELIYGAPEDVHLAPSSEDGYNAILAYVALHESRGGREWLELARRAADWTMTFRWSYNVAFPPETILGQYGFATRGADLASPSNQHLHAYGLICVAELLRLARHAGDPYYRQRALDHLACFRQFIARRDGDFAARRGMVTERYYHTNCFGPKGSILTLSHAWCVGLALEANLAMLEAGDALS